MPAERTSMRQVREVVRLKFVGGVSAREIARRSPKPADRVLAICEAAGWAVTPHELSPDLYRYETDGLPPEVRKAA